MKSLLSWTVLGALVAPVLAQAADVKVSFPFARTNYQTNETITLAVSRSDAADLQAGSLVVNLSGKDGSKLSFAFPAAAAKAVDGKVQRTELLNLSGQLLRPGQYTVEVAVDGATGTASFELFSHVRRSTFRTINWGSPRTNEDQQVQGEFSLGYNLIYTSGGVATDPEGDYLKGGSDQMAVCIMSGGHQMDLRMECDWSDPYVVRGGTRRAAQEAFKARLRGNSPGVNFYDEPGLTWRKQEDGTLTPHDIPSQVASYEATFGTTYLMHDKLDPKNPAQVAQWMDFGKWKQGFMEAAWRDAVFAVEQVDSKLISATQSQYGWSAFTDGYYFNISRALPITSGHGGYDDLGCGYLFPSYTLEMARARDMAKANWYLPTWYGNINDDAMRFENLAAFSLGIQGVMTPPGCVPTENPANAQGSVEANLFMLRLGPVFTVGIEQTRQPVAVLYSISSLLKTQSEAVNDNNYAHGMRHGQWTHWLYVASKMAHQSLTAVVDEDVLDGSVAANHKAIIVAGADYLDPGVIAGLEQFAKNGGKVFVADSKVQIPGAIDIGLAAIPKLPDEDADVYKAAVAAKQWNDLAPYQTASKYMEAAKPLADALTKTFGDAGIKPLINAEGQGVLAPWTFDAGEITYVFIANATPVAGGKKNDLGTAKASITLPVPAANVYDAFRGGKTAELSGQAPVSFGPGQVRAFAVADRPIGGVKTSTPTISIDYTVTDAPITLNVGATLLDDQNDLLAAAAPVRIRVIDPLGATRHDVYRSTKAGVLSESFPLAANDPAGEYHVIVTDLLADTSDESTVKYAPAGSGAVAGTTTRAVMFEDDFDKIYRFAKTNSAVTIVPGKSAYNQAAAERLAKILTPWGIKATIMSVDEASKSRSLSDQEAVTWVGMAYAPPGQIKPGAENPPAISGFVVQGPVILLGNPEDNAIIKLVQDSKFLPYNANAELPGRGRGYLAWQREAVGAGQESVTLIAYDEAGMSEAVGSMHEIASGIKPLTRWTQPASATLAPATVAETHAELAVAWRARLSDRITGLKVEGDSIQALSHDGSITPLTGGKPGEAKAVAAADYAKLVTEWASKRAGLEDDKKFAAPARRVKFVVPAGERTAVAYWGGLVRIYQGDQVAAQTQFPQDITSFAATGNALVVGLADGQVIGTK